MKKKYINRILIGLLFIGVILLFQVLGIGKYFNLASLKENRGDLQQLVQAHYVRAVLIYIAFYIGIVAFLIPIAALCTIAGGFLFGTFWGAVYANIGATVGAVIAFLLVRYSVGNAFQERYKDYLHKFNRSVHEQGVMYLILIHFIAVIPFFVINVLAGLTKVPLWTFIWTTSVGIVPSTLVYTFTGQQLNTIESIKDIFSWHLVLAFSLFALLALLPMLIRRYRKGRILSCELE